MKYVGFDIPNEFVVGYGLDYAERYRNLRSIATLRPARLLVSPPVTLFRLSVSPRPCDNRPLALNAGFADR